jgi:heterodisulfide reductase subunit A-like polyferredoxin
MKQMAAIPELENIGAVLVCGAGIAGIQASLDLAGSGFKVYLLDSSAAIGGRMAQLDKTFPTGDCAMCILSPKLVECARNRNIEIVTLADIQSVSGRPGSFQVKIRQNPRYVDMKKCDACGDCTEACPVNLPSEFDRGLGTRKAIYRPYPQAIPNVFSISKSAGQVPCRAFCPAGVNVPGSVALIAAGKLTEAYDLIRQRCPLPASCGRVCRHPCQTRCTRNEVDEAVSVGHLERFVADHFRAHPDQHPPFASPASRLDGRVAIIGGGPAGLTAATDLALMGYRVTLFEAKPHLGGMLRYGIPGYRLPKDVLDKEIENILGLGVEVRTNTLVAKPKDLLRSKASSNANSVPADGFNAVFVATGAWRSRKLGIPGEDARGVWEGLNFLCEVNAGNVPGIGPKVMVIGGTDFSLDVARCARRLPGVESVQLACLESRAEMPAPSGEVAEALEEGVIFHNGLGPTRIEAAEGRAASVTFRACTSVFDEFRRFDPLFDDTNICTLAADTVIVAVGRGIDSSGFAMETRPGGRIFADQETLATSIKGIFAGGDAVLGPASMVDAMAQGHLAAEAMDAYIRGTAYIRSTDAARVSTAAPSNPRPVEFAPNPKPDAPRQNCVPMPQAALAGRLRGFAEINLGYSREQAISEAQRCLSCGLCSECMQCVKACSAGAVVHDQQPAEIDIEVGSIILAPGIEEFQTSGLEEFGCGRYPNVLSGVQFERMLSATGPTGGCLERPSDRGEVRKIAFLQCVGSRDAARGRGYCSSVCCMSAAKEAMVASERSQGRPLDISIFCTDVRAFGKEFDGYIDRARDEQGVQYIRARPSRVTELPGGQSLRISYLDASGAMQHQEFDLVVLSAGIQVSRSVKDMAGRLGLELNQFGFAQTQRFSPLTTSRPGIYVAGAFQEPKDIPESAAQGSAAAACAMDQLTAVRGTMIQHPEYPWERDVADEPPRIGVFVCHCGHNIASVIDVDWVARKAAQMPNVCYAEANVYTCSDANQQHIRGMINKYRINRLVVASCSSRTHEVLFQETLRESGLNQYLFAMTNIRDQCSWVHKNDPAAATAKAIDLVSMAVARARHLKALPLNELPVTASALILGGGLAGMTAAQSIAGQGFKVHLVEREPFLGGLLRNIHTALEGADVRAYLQQLVDKTLSHPKISVYLDSNLAGISGQVGNFSSVLNVAGRETPVSHGVVIVATGGQERLTEQFLHGRNPHVMTQSRLESVMAGGNLLAELGGKPNPTVLMIQCVESRNEKNPYCSRVCCAEAIKNALEVKRCLPRCRVVILGRDIRTYGFREMFYGKALEQGVQFVRHPDRRGPEVVEEEGRLTVKVRDASVNRDLVFNPDLLVLSTGISPASDNPELSRMLRSALTADGFFLEAHPKLRPVDLANEGEFLCGLAHSPRFMDETIAQAQAAAARASTILSKAQLEILGQVAHIDPADCVACATCVKICPYGAPMINELRKAEIQGAKCMGCGSCVAACPARTIVLQHQEGQTVVAMLDELLVGGGSL